MRSSLGVEINLPSIQQLGKFTAALLGWYQDHGRYFPWRKKTATNYERIIAEILLQRTKAETIAIFYPKFVDQYPSWRKLGGETEGELQEWFKPIGLWRRRASSLHELSKEMVKRSGRFPKERSEIESLPGIGQYIANAILLFCYGIPQPLLDTSMARVLERYFGPRNLVDIRYDPYLQSLAKFVVGEDPISAVQLNWAILDLAALVCKKVNPTCSICPVNFGCLFRMEEDRNV